MATTFDYLGEVNVLPRSARYLFEVLAAYMLLYVVVMGVRDRFQNVRAPYFFIFGAIFIVMLCGLLLNQVAPGPLFTGMRNYFRPIPLFFLPAVLAFTDRQLLNQLKTLLLVALVQIPIAVLQRLHTTNGTGDNTVGTLHNSAHLSLFEIGGICLLGGLFLRKRVSLTVFILLFLLLVFPTTINETKATFLLLPFGLLVVFQVLAAPGTRAKNFIVGAMLIAVFIAVFIPVYDYLISHNKYKTNVTDFFTQSQKMEKYLGKNAQLGVSDYREAGRLDAIIVPLRTLSKDPSHLVFGLGMGNASNSSWGDQFIGEYFPMFEFFLQTNVTRLLLELGLAGVGLIMLLYWTIYKDCLVVAANDRGLRGALAAGWAGFTAVIVIANFYKDLVPSDALSCLFWYFSGLVAAQRMRLAHGSVQKRPGNVLMEKTVGRLTAKST